MNWVSVKIVRNSDKVKVIRCKFIVCICAFFSLFFRVRFSFIMPGTVVANKAKFKNVSFAGSLAFCSSCRRILGYVDESDIVHVFGARLLKFEPNRRPTTGLEGFYTMRISSDITVKRQYPADILDIIDEPEIKRPRLNLAVKRLSIEPILQHSSDDLDQIFDNLNDNSIEEIFNISSTRASTPITISSESDLNISIFSISSTCSPQYVPGSETIKKKSPKIFGILKCVLLLLFYNFFSVRFVSSLFLLFFDFILDDDAVLEKNTPNYLFSPSLSVNSSMTFPFLFSPQPSTSTNLPRESLIPVKSFPIEIESDDDSAAKISNSYVRSCVH